MDKEYNFNVEDIESVTLCNIESDNQFSMIFVRKSDSEFIQSFNAIDIVGDMDENNNGTLEFVCERCGDTNKIPNLHFVTTEEGISYPEPEVEYECKYCAADYEIIISENDVIDMLMSAFSEDGMEIFINEIKIK